MPSSESGPRVSEGLRSGSRQQQLYAQGRSQPGPVVTWTLDSAHMQGEAADLVLDGQWEDLEPYRILQRVAKEEGLKTLGMRDPGHVELAKSADTDRQDRPRLAAGERPGRRPLTRAAPVARVASRATVARVATPAPLGGSGPPRPAPRTSEAEPAPTPQDRLPERPAPIREPVPHDLPEPIERIATHRVDTSRVVRSAETDVRPQADTSGAAVQAQPSSSTGSASVGSTSGVESGIAERVEQVRTLQEAGGSRGVRHHVDLGDVDGSGTRVRVDLRGGKVGARIDVVDPALRTVMKRQTGELETALRARGLEAEPVQIKAALEGEPALGNTLKALDSTSSLETELKDSRGRERGSTKNHGEDRGEPGLRRDRKDQERKR